MSNRYGREPSAVSACATTRTYVQGTSSSASRAWRRPGPDRPPCRSARAQQPLTDVPREFTRAQRLSARALRVFATMTYSELRDPRLSGVQFTHVAFSPDLSVCRVWYLPGSADGETTAASLKAASGYMRKRLGESFRLRRQPELRFVLDESIARGEALEDLIEDAVRKDQAARK
ncbi:MAG: 30S ribosome-binding factor RbfA [Gammaproteobacteria bacterium]|nr:30S ribosome-binding factor RbfA [Gammaproteobacteria bacterium]MDE0414104.1 30S ribosome-binding factor RbfA [Gammaproteobacteria bacterium]